MRKFLLLLLMLAQPACTALMVGGGSSGAYKPATGAGSATMTMSDAEIIAGVGAAFDADPGLKMFGLGIRSDGGNVTLTGSVDTYAARERAEKLAIAADGVRSVDNQIRVKGTR